jgi:hypothetical protein
MRVWFTNPTNGLPYAVAEEPLFRGAIVETYANKKWSPHVDVSASDPSELERLPRGAPHVLQKIALEEQPDVQKRLGAQKQPQNTVFSLLPAYRLDSSSPIEFDRRRQQLIRKNPTGRIEFTLATTGLDNGRQVKIIPAWEAPGSRERKRLTTLPEGPQKQELLPRLKQFAANAVANVPQQETIQRARALEAALGPANGFGYSLEGVPRNPALDPVEDFISEHKQGHCEYFATALTLMLRSQGIPARLVIGFKGGEFNSLGNYYQVRMLHAHTWVEAYLEPDQLPAGFTPRRLGGGWLTLDATPGSEESAEGRTLSLAAQAREWMDYGDYLWMNYVVGLDSRRQQEAIYGPLSLSGRAIRRVFTARFWTRTVPQWFGSLLERDTWRNLVSQRPSWSLIVLAVGLLFSLFLAWRKRKSLAGWFRRLWQWRPKLRRAQGRRGLARPRPVVPFYEQLEKLLAAHGIRRPESQTQHEFAMAAQGQLSETPRLAAAATLPRKVVDAFYQVRFGRRTLDKDELEQVQRSLRELAAALAG